ncbi:MAG: dTMP kinase [Euryarchaeota archaeon]|nr:dTMP kinase [Euryarchaeota archaeon]MDE1837574.1 dTMP kinase [Euryarchaeota archaeon]MDE1881313.1 dTMP kinase [Euryarchaeota archaeon]MDE2045885.1 dTMP kinase [Thermoplasmata archaeon]
MPDPRDRLDRSAGGSRPVSYPGRLIVFEGLDGSGKSTQAHLLLKWLTARGYRAFFTEWNSSELVSEIIRRGKKKNLLTPSTFSLLHATDFADRYERHILPPLRAGYIVICDRYIYTAYARDVARGCDPEWVRNLYAFAVPPDKTFYFRVPVETAHRRKEASRLKIKYYEAGMDMHLSDDVTESYLRFQGLLKRQYDQLARSEGYHVIEAEQQIEHLQREVRSAIRPLLGGFPKEEVLMHGA